MRFTQTFNQCYYYEKLKWLESLSLQSCTHKVKRSRSTFFDHACIIISVIQQFMPMGPLIFLHSKQSNIQFHRLFKKKNQSFLFTKYYFHFVFTKEIIFKVLFLPSILWDELMILLNNLVVIFKPQILNFFLNEKHNGTTYKLQSSFLMKKKQRN